MERDLRIILWIFVVSLFVFVIYSIVDYTFASMDNPKNYSYYASIARSYTHMGDPGDPGNPQLKNWMPPREPLPFMGYVHFSIVFMITGIFTVTLIGFLIAYFMSRRN